METRVLILNPDPVFEDRLLSIFDFADEIETCIVRTIAEGVAILIGETAFGVSGVVMGPIIYAYLKRELRDRGFV